MGVCGCVCPCACVFRTKGDQSVDVAIARMLRDGAHEMVGVAMPRDLRGEHAAAEALALIREKSGLLHLENFGSRIKILNKKEGTSVHLPVCTVVGAPHMPGKGLLRDPRQLVLPGIRIWRHQKLLWENIALLQACIFCGGSGSTRCS